jgi:protein SCO1
MMQSLKRHRIAGMLVGLACAVLSTPVVAQRMEPAPKEVENVGVDAHLGVQLPLDLPFVDSDRTQVTLRRFFDGKRPVILTLNYSNCPMLCSLQLNGFFEALGRMTWNLGENFQMVTVSIDPRELPERAQSTKQKYLKLYGRPGVANGWHVLTGEERNIRRLADTVGFRYRYVNATGEYAHAAVTMILTPDGRMSRYLYGIEYDPQTIKLSLVEAGEGKIGSAMDQIILFCFHYDETKGRYGPAALAVMRVAGVLCVIGLAGMVYFFARGASRQADTPAETPATQPESSG